MADERQFSVGYFRMARDEELDDPRATFYVLETVHVTDDECLARETALGLWHHDQGRLGYIVRDRDPDYANVLKGRLLREAAEAQKRAAKKKRDPRSWK